VENRQPARSKSSQWVFTIRNALHVQGRVYDLQVYVSRNGARTIWKVPINGTWEHLNVHHYPRHAFKGMDIVDKLQSQKQPR
jgi:hypothetical protein